MITKTQAVFQEKIMSLISNPVSPDDTDPNRYEQPEQAKTVISPPATPAAKPPTPPRPVAGPTVQAVFYYGVGLIALAALVGLGVARSNDLNSFFEPANLIGFLGLI